MTRAIVVTKADMADIIATKLGSSRALVVEIYNAMMEEIGNAIEEGRPVALSGVGSIETSKTRRGISVRIKLTSSMSARLHAQHEP